jgi:hypothetical protein
MNNQSMFKWMKKLCDYDSFQTCLGLTNRSLKEQYDMELLLRFLVLRSIDESKLKNIGDIGEFLTDQMVEMSQKNEYQYGIEEEAFKITFEVLQAQMSSDSFRKYDEKQDKFTGGFLVSAFEVIALGIGYNYKQYKERNIDLKPLIKDIWINSDYPTWSGGGTDAKRRIPKLIPLGRKKFIG